MNALEQASGSAAPVEQAMIQALAARIQEIAGISPLHTTSKIAARLGAMPADDRKRFAATLLQTSTTSQVLNTLIESILIHETYFFRHPTQLDFIRDDLLPLLLENRGAGPRPLSVWSAACSTGEETWTIAMILLSALKQRDSALSLQVLGTDLSAESIAVARKGRYQNSAALGPFRSIPESERWRFAGVLEGSGANAPVWEPPPELKRSVRFDVHNLITLPPLLESVDLIVCRNALIYFDAPQARIAEQNLVRALRRGGLLIVGPGEQIRTREGLSTLRHKGFVAYCKTASGGN